MIGIFVGIAIAAGLLMRLGYMLGEAREEKRTKAAIDQIVANYNKKLPFTVVVRDANGREKSYQTDYVYQYGDCIWAENKNVFVFAYPKTNVEQIFSPSYQTAPKVETKGDKK